MRASALLLCLLAAPLEHAVAQSQLSAKERIREGHELRIANARRSFAGWAATAQGDATALVSFSAHLPPARIRELLTACKCEPLQLYRTIGELQLSGGDPRKLFMPDADRSLGDDLAEALEFRLDATKGPPPPDRLTPEEAQRQERANRAEKAVLSDARAGRPRFTGVFVRGSPDGLRALAASPDVLALEISRSAGSFPVTIDLLEPAR